MYISHFKYNILSAEEHQVFKEILTYTILLYLFNPISNSKLKFTIVSHSILNIWQQWYTKVVSTFKNLKIWPFVGRWHIRPPLMNICSTLQIVYRQIFHDSLGPEKSDNSCYTFFGSNTQPHLSEIFSKV